MRDGGHGTGLSVPLSVDQLDLLREIGDLTYWHNQNAWRAPAPDIEANLRHRDRLIQLLEKETSCSTS